jgi:hypothetical protein
MANKNIPTYEIAIDDVFSKNPAVNYIALVDLPAIEKGWMMFGKQDSPFVFKTTPQNKERRIITGALMIADLPIYRNTKDRGEFNVVFRKDQIETIVKKFAKGNYYNNVNLMHTSELEAQGIYMIESFIIDKERGITTPSLFETAPDGSWFVSYYVENDILWNEYIMKGRFTGFSVECFMDILFAPKEDKLQASLLSMAQAFKNSSNK